jgi:hypothetical protein
MNILWIEDFGGDLAADESTVARLFGDLIDGSLIDEHWDPDQNLIDNNAYITDFFSEHSQFHKVYLCRNYHDFNHFKNTCVINQDIDLIIIDIRLDNINAGNALFPDNYSDPGAQNAFNLNAGFYIYNLLIKSGFPDDYVCLLTGEKNSYEEFKKNCKKLYLREPLAFEKDDVGYADIKKWIADKKSSKRVQLKRGILDGINESRNYLEEPFEFINHIDDKFSEEKSAINKVYIENYLNAIESNVNNKYFDDLEITKSLTLLVRAITHEWDSKIDRRPNRFVFVLRQIRNMTAHNNKLEVWCEEDAALLFLISMRHLVNYKNHTQIFPYEAKLFALIRNSESLSRNSVLDEIGRDKQAFRNLLKENNITPGWYISGVKELLDRDDVDSNLLKERIYKSIWDYFDDYQQEGAGKSKAVKNVLYKSDSDFKLQFLFALAERYESSKST